MLATPPTPVLPEPARRPTAVAVSLAGAALGVLAVRYAGVEGPSWFDVSVEGPIRDTAAPVRSQLRTFVRLGSPPQVVLMTILLGAVGFVARRPRLALVVLAGPPVTGLVTTTLQPLIGRTLEGGFALPSGHAGGATSVAIAAALVVVNLVPKRARTVVAAIAAVGVLAVWSAITVALVANGLHYASDTVASLCAAVVVVLGIPLAVDHLAGRFRTGPSSPV
ncbi:phosphatase PAP2 family protein [Pseudonocardia sp. TRM90224]|uniref:phosphatase PAP2 family protein n=1 Tax=Pseudonocardia sp. TRM90224 TaxID=2812678 RepID=UPI001E47ACB6|nr:phosphatase PAP2 family protein [Pseudonocardia sp. TRM90224]